MKEAFPYSNLKVETDVSQETILYILIQIFICMTLSELKLLIDKIP